MMRFNGFGHGFSNGFGCPFFGMQGYGFWGMGLFLLAVAVLVIVLVKRNRNQSGHKIAADALDMRFAKGEISEDEYLQKKRVLQGK